MSKKEITTYSAEDGAMSSRSVDRGPLTNVELDDARGFDMVCGNGYAMPIMRKRSS